MNNNNINRSLNSEWYQESDKKRNIRTKNYYADACILSRNKDKTEKSNQQKIVKTADDFLPMSGSEPDYDPKTWNKNEKDRRNHNCYAYFLNHFIEGRYKRPQPGHRDPNINTFRKQDYTREEITRRAIYDNPSLYCVNPDAVCEKGYYKGALVIDPYNNYHWLRQNSNGYWSHKPGQLPVTLADADGKLIKDPRKANMIYDKDRKDYNLIYSDVGPFFCVPNPEKGANNVKIQSHTCAMCGGGKGSKKCSIKKKKNNK